VLKSISGNNKVAKLKKYKPLLLFLVKAVSFYYGILYLFLGYVGLADPRGSFTLPGFLQDYNLILMLTRSYVVCSEFVVNLLGYATESSTKILRIAGSGGVRIEFACLGVELWIAFIALILAYPVSLKRKNLVRFLTCAAGITIIYLLNVVRVTTILLTNYYSKGMTSVIHDIFNYGVYILIFIGFGIYISRTSKAGHSSSAIESEV
jgi:exosortase/archaeosortase family protein